jgi:hypothetical protein
MAGVRHHANRNYGMMPEEQKQQLPQASNQNPEQEREPADMNFLNQSAQN